MNRSPHRLLALPVVLAAGALALSGCAQGEVDAGDGDGTITVVASTSVYGSIAEAIGGDHVSVVSIVTSSAQDPHSYEASAQDQLEVSRGDLLVENGGGYDAFMSTLIAGADSEAPVITAAEYAHDWPGDDDHSDDHADDHDDHADDDHGHDDHDHIEGFNEHVWYDPHTMEHLAESIAEELSALDPDNAATFSANAETFSEGIHELEEALAAIEAEHAGEEVFVTEPVAGYLVQAAGLSDVAPSAFSEAVEEGQDVPPATLLEAQNLLRGGDVTVVIVNAQTGGAETDAVIADAEAQSIPVVEMAETLPDGLTYLEWMTQNVDALAVALDR